MSDFVLSRLTRAARFAMMASAVACAAQVHAQASPSDDDQDDEAPAAAAPASKPAAPAAAAATGLNRPITVKIHETSLGAALGAWALQTGYQIVYASQDVASQAAATPVDGTMTAQEALTRLLPAGVSFRLVNAGTVMVGSRSALAQSAAPAPAPAPEPSAAQRIEIVGTHIQSDAAPPATKVIDAEQIARAGYSSVEDVFRHFVQAGGGATSMGTSLGQTEYGESRPPTSSIGASSINLRGLGSRATLILVDGRRIAGSAQGAGMYTDISSIPISQVERIEVLTDGASAIYGADAVGGVVNIVLKKDYVGTQAQLRLEKSNTGADMQRFSLARSFSWEGGKLSAAGLLQRTLPSDLTNHLHVGPSGLGDMTDLGGINNRLIGMGDRGVVYSAGQFPSVNVGAGKFWAPKAVLGQVPQGQTGPLAPSDLEKLDADNLPTLFRPLIAGPTDMMASIRLDGTQNLSNGHELYGGLSLARQRNTSMWRPNGWDFGFMAASKIVDGPVPGKKYSDADITRYLTLVSPNNPYNHFGKPVLVGYSFNKEMDSLGLSNEETQRNTSGYVGVRGPLSWAGWSYDASLTRSQESSRSIGYRSDAMGTSFDAIPGLVDSVRDSLNLFTDGSDPAVIASNVRQLKRLVTSNRTWASSSSTLADGVIRGPLYQLDAGPVDAAFGVQFRDERLARAMEGVSIDVDAKRSVAAAFGEVGIPLLKDLPAAKKLGVALAARYEYFKQSGVSVLNNYAVAWDAKDNPIDLMKKGGYDGPSVFGMPYVAIDPEMGMGVSDPFQMTSTFGNISPSIRLNWEPVDSLVLRATAGRSFLTPAASQMYGYVTLDNIFDYWMPEDPPLPAGTTGAVAMNGVNFTLKPQVAHTQTLGFDWMPLQDEDGMLRFSATYSHTRFDNFIGNPADDIGTARYVDYLLHSSTPPPIQNGVMLVDLREINFARRETSSLDLAAMYAVDTPIGNLGVDFEASRLLSLLSQPLASMPVFQFGNTELGPPRWKANLTTSLNTGDYTTTVGLHYTSPFSVVQPASAFGLEPNPNPRTKAASYTTVDVQLGYEPQEGSLQGWKFAVGAQNVFDKAYPFVDNFQGFLADRVATRGRVIYFDVTAKF